MQDLAYPEQLKAKEAALLRLFGDAGSGAWQGRIPVAPSPAVWDYRNKVEVNFGRKHYPEPPPEGFVRETVFGFKKTGAWFWTLDIETCKIVSPEFDALLAAVRDWTRASGLRAYSSRGGRDGFLRHLIVREGKRTGQRMVVLTTRGGAPEHGTWDPEAFVGAVRAAYPATSIQRGINDGIADQAVPERVDVLWGEGTIDEELRVPGRGRSLRFSISPFSFFQTNTLATEVLYGKVREWVAAVKPAKLYDLYGGMGSIAFSVSDLVPEVHSVESWEPASRDGERSAVVNGIDNVTFTARKVEAWLGELVSGLRGQRGADGKPKDGRSAAGGLGAGAAVIVDPPRSGLNPKALRRLVELRPERILYISCKSSALASELPAFLAEYRLASLEAVDLFPHTEHVEVLAAFELK